MAELFWWKRRWIRTGDGRRWILKISELFWFPSHTSKLNSLKKINLIMGMNTLVNEFRGCEVLVTFHVTVDTHWKISNIGWLLILYFSPFHPQFETILTNHLNFTMLPTTPTNIIQIIDSERAKLPGNHRFKALQDLTNKIFRKHPDPA